MAIRGDMPAPGEVVGGKYRIEKVLGEGGMGSVYAAVHEVTGKRVAVKWMHPEYAVHPEARARFLQEAKVAGRIDHPNVVDVYDVGQDEEAMFLVMEILHGEPLSSLIAERALSPVEAVEILVPAMRGVAAAHRHGVVHRDLKPDNIFLARGPEGRLRGPKVLDFGISKIASTDATNFALTKTGAVMGTPYYMSPEQVTAEKGIDERCDVYALGVILYEALTGVVPFEAETYSAMMVKIATEPAVPVRERKPDLPEGLEQVVMRALEKKPDDRFADVRSLAEALEPYGGGVRFDEPRGDWTEPRRFEAPAPTPFATEAVPQRSGHGTRWVLVVGVLFGLGLAGVGAVLGFGGSADPSPPAAPVETPAATSAGFPAEPAARDPAPAPDRPAPLVVERADPSEEVPTPVAAPEAERPASEGEPQVTATHPAMVTETEARSRRGSSTGRLVHGRAASELRPPRPAAAERPVRSPRSSRLSADEF